MIICEEFKGQNASFFLNYHNWIVDHEQQEIWNELSKTGKCNVSAKWQNVIVSRLKYGGFYPISK